MALVATAPLALRLAIGQVLAADSPIEGPAEPAWFVTQDTTRIGVAEPFVFDSINLSAPFELQHVVKADKSRAAEQGAIVIQTTRISRYRTGEAASEVFFNKIDADQGLAPEAPLKVSFEEFSRFHQGLPISRNAERWLRAFYHTTLRTSAGEINTDGLGEQLAFRELGENAQRLVRATTILRFAIQDGYPLKFSTGGYAPDFIRVHFRIVTLNYDMTPVEFVLERAR